MSQGPRTRVRLDGQVYRVIRSSVGIHVYERTTPGHFKLIWNSRTGKLTQHQPAHITRILAAEAESV